MGISGVSASGCQYQGQAVPAASRQAREEARPQSVPETLEQQQDSQPDLTEMMKQAREKAKEREKMFQLPKNSRRYGDAAITAYSKLARAKSAGEVDAASGYARRQIAQLQAAKRSDSENADRIQAAINQLQKAVNRAGRKKREISQERLSDKRQAKLEREKRTAQARRLRQQQKNKRAMRVIRESGYLREAEVDNRLQDQIAASKLELREQMRELSEQTQLSSDAAARQYAAAAAEPVPAPEISVQA